MTKVRVIGKGVDVHIILDDEIDYEIVQFSLDCAKLASKSWFHPVQGNHEQLMYESVFPDVRGQFDLWMYNGGAWFHSALDGEGVNSMKAISLILKGLPHIIVIGKDSMAQAMAELLESQPDINLLNMDDNNIWSVAELFLGHEACNRLQIDIGQRFESSTLSPRDAVARVNEMHEFLKAEISNQMDLLRARNTNPSPRQLESIMQLAIKNTFSIYEGLL